MSRPIYEPSLPRADAELGYGNRQLFRRPAPRAQGGISIWRGFRYDPAIEDLDSTNQNLDWNWWDNCDSSIFEETMFGDLVRGIVLKQAGRYTFTVGVYFDDVVDGFKIGVHDSGDDPFGFADDFFGGSDNYNTSGWHVFTLVRLWPKIDPFGPPWEIPNFGGGGNVTIFFTIAVIAAGAITMPNAFVEITHEDANECVVPPSS